MRKILFLLLAVAPFARPQAPPTSVQSTVYSNITAAQTLDGCDLVTPTPCIDNRSAFTRQDSYYAYRAYNTASGTWEVDMQYAEATAPTVWTSFGATGQVTNSSPVSGIGYALGPLSYTKNYHDYIRFVISGANASTVVIENYFGTKQSWWSTTTNTYSFPLTFGQGGTGTEYGAPYNVLAFGAVGNGSTNDTAAIITAIDAACISPSPYILFPAGYTFGIAPTVKANSILPYCSNLKIDIEGTLQIMASSGSYCSIWGAYCTSPSPVSHVRLFGGGTIDQNTTNNPLVSSGDLNSYPRIVFYDGGAGGTDNVVSGIHSTNVACVWEYLLGATNPKIINTTSDNIGGTVAHDSSLLYIENNANGFVISGNTATTTSPNTDMAVTMIETHAEGTITGNFSLNLSNGENIVGDSATITNGVTSTGNVHIGVNNGISLYSQNTNGSPRVGLQFVTVTDNVIINNWLSYAPTLPGNGISIAAANNLPIAGIKINNNLIAFDLSTSTSDPYNVAAGFGVGYYDGTLSGIGCLLECDFSSNTIINAPTAGGYYLAEGANVSFDNETILNPGSGLNPSLTGAYRAGIFAGGEVAPIVGTVSIKGGTISDTLGTCRFAYGIDIAGVNTTGIIIDGVTISATDATCTSLQTAIYPNTNTQLPYIRATVNVPSGKVLTGGSTVANGSTIYSMGQGLLYTYNPANASGWYNFVSHSGTLTASAGCGSSPSITGTDRGGVITLGTSPSGTCTLTFALAFGTSPLLGPGGYVINESAGSGGSIIVPQWGASTTTVFFSVVSGAVAGSVFTWGFPLAN